MRTLLLTRLWLPRTVGRVGIRRRYSPRVCWRFTAEAGEQAVSLERAEKLKSARRYGCSSSVRRPRSRTAACSPFVLAKALDATMGLRVTAAEESEGLDIALHDETGFHL